MSIYGEWLGVAYNKSGQPVPKLWDVYMPKEQKIYEYLLTEKVTSLNGTIKELAERFEMSQQYICGFIDGLSDVLAEPIDMESLEPSTEVALVFDFETLYKTMVSYKAEHLYNLPEWNHVFTEEKRKALFWETKKSSIYIRSEAKVGRNEPCTCGSGKKYKKCCGLK